jgi:isopenicillin N synthase-like dioxygenase
MITLVQNDRTDTLKSTLHRVRAPDTVDENGMTLERFSIPYVRRKTFSLFAT